MIHLDLVLSCQSLTESMEEICALWDYTRTRDPPSTRLSPEDTQKCTAASPRGRRRHCDLTKQQYHTTVPCKQISPYDCSTDEAIPKGGCDAVRHRRRMPIWPHRFYTSDSTARRLTDCRDNVIILCLVNKENNCSDCIVGCVMMMRGAR